MNPGGAIPPRPPMQVCTTAAWSQTIPSTSKDQLHEYIADFLFWAKVNKNLELVSEFKLRGDSQSDVVCSMWIRNDQSFRDLLDEFDKEER